MVFQASDVGVLGQLTHANDVAEHFNLSLEELTLVNDFDGYVLLRLLVDALHDQRTCFADAHHLLLVDRSALRLHWPLCLLWRDRLVLDLDIIIQV